MYDVPAKYEIAYRQLWFCIVPILLPNRMQHPIVRHDSPNNLSTLNATVYYVVSMI